MIDELLRCWRFVFVALSPPTLADAAAQSLKHIGTHPATTIAAYQQRDLSCRTLGSMSPINTAALTLVVRLCVQFPLTPANSSIIRL